MDKRDLITLLSQRRAATGLSHAQLAERAGITERSVRNVLGPHGNPQLGSLLALVQALGLELQVVPRGFGAVPEASADGYRPVATRIDEALAAPPARASVPGAAPVSANRAPRAGRAPKR